MSDNRNSTCVMWRQTARKLNKVVMGKQPFSSYFAQKNTWFLIEFKAIIQSGASHEVRNCESMFPKAEPQEIIEALESEW